MTRIYQAEMEKKMYKVLIVEDEKVIADNYSDFKDTLPKTK